MSQSVCSRAGVSHSPGNRHV